MENYTQQFEAIESEARARSISVLLDQIESRLGKMTADMAVDGLPILVELDEVYRRLRDYTGTGNSIKAEKSQFDYVQSTIRSNLRLLLRHVGGAAKLQAMRAQRKPAPEQWWWFLDELAAQGRQSLIRRAGFTLAGVLVVAALLVVVYRAFLAPDAATLARFQHQRTAETALMQGDIDTALTEINQALLYDPENTELMVMQAIGQELTGQDEAATASFARLKILFGSEEEFLLQRALYYNQFGRSDLALADTEIVLAANPQSALGQFYAGVASESLGQFTEALEYYEIGYELALEQDMTALAATIRMNMGMLMQALPGLVTNDLQEQEQ
jgi:tetratricopeptide (TPR) repeat protein